jgi:hypothetical protein
MFPNGQMLGASFNRSLFTAVGRVIGEELRAIRNLNGAPSGFSCWSPDINLARDPRWGRAQEVPGEDPYLTGVLFIVIYSLYLIYLSHFTILGIRKCLPGVQNLINK